MVDLTYLNRLEYLSLDQNYSLKLVALFSNTVFSPETYMRRKHMGCGSCWPTGKKKLRSINSGWVKKIFLKCFFTSQLNYL
jgi:hypothetical protein